MRRILHLSDLHFGRIHLPTIEPLIAVAQELEPEVIAISGDLTQRARLAEFHEAAEFLDRLPFPKVVVPGNHDVPLYNVFSRFAMPLSKYRQIITPELFPMYIDDEVAVVGVNTARSLTTKYGRINMRQVRRIREVMCEVGNVIKVVVTHHPFDLPERYSEQHLVGRAALAMEMLAECRVDVFLSGHLHVTHYGQTVERYKVHNYAALFVQAGTATSDRLREEGNSFNLLEIDRGLIRVKRFQWQPTRELFAVDMIKDFSHTQQGWKTGILPREVLVDAM